MSLFKKIFTYKILNRPIIDWVTEIVSKIDLESDRKKYMDDIDIDQYI